MRIVGLLVLAAIMLSIAKVALLALYLTLILALIVGAMTKPAETFSLIGCAMVAFMLQAHPLATMGALLAAFVIGSVWKSRAP
ncbi:MAG: hypothetical protein EON58_16505 [Alphaproteobacteria bacterium]|nr:MAG: hypothetical protein EON58_16505 [Alphaproteobacteria bacterium]